MLKKPGLHPDFPIKRSRTAATRYVTLEAICPVCQRKGRISKKGHMRISGRQTDGNQVVLDVINGECECGNRLPFFFNYYGGDIDSILDFGSFYAAYAKGRGSECPPGKYHFLSASGDIDYDWIQEIILNGTNDSEKKCRNCSTKVGTAVENAQGKMLIIPFSTKDPRWDNIIKENVKLSCNDCGKSFCINCCVWHKFFAENEHHKKTFLGSNFAYIPKCPNCESMLYM